MNKLISQIIKKILFFVLRILKEITFFILKPFYKDIKIHYVNPAILGG